MKRKISTWNRIIMLACAIAAIAVLFVPMWRIDLVAPQYPEGLFLLIHPHKLAGNVDIINGLNHYIGMKTLHADDFPEFRILPYVLIGFAALFLLTAAAGKKILLNISFAAYLLFGILAMYDFWQWEYNYGHNLNPDAAIKVPGMSYQPPLIGYKQLLNFSAYSMPDIGGWIFVAIGATLLGMVVISWRRAAGVRRSGNAKTALLLLMVTMILYSCNAGPEPLRTGIDNCAFCRMTLSDQRFGAEIITKKGKLLKFDDSHCVLAYLSASLPEKELKAVYFVNYSGTHDLVNADKAFFLKADLLQSPMGGNVAAFANRTELEQVQQQLHGQEMTWAQLKQQP
jgi:copper chaperone NosL